MSVILNKCTECAVCYGQSSSEGEEEDSEDSSDDSGEESSDGEEFGISASQRDLEGADVRNAEKAEGGILSKLFLQNFMCHTQLEVNFGNVVNFVIGRNGSGKSAILTAVTIVLGGKASVTNRGGEFEFVFVFDCSGKLLTGVVSC